jgi:hypothetical protein
MNQYPSASAAGGHWNAYCEGAVDHEDYLTRLTRVPDHLRADVIRHCQTVAALRELKRRRMNAIGRSGANSSAWPMRD